jgi:DNA-binding CsgD family transcriptional regulator
MSKEEELFDFIESVYDAALDPSQWTGIVARCAAFVGSPAASLYSRDALIKSVDVTCQVGLDPRFVQSYANTYTKLDPAVTSYLFAKIGEPIATASVMPYSEFLETRLYREWGHPQDFADAANTLLERTTTSTSFLIVFRHHCDGLVDSEVRRRLKLIVPHIRRALLIGKSIELKRTEAATFTDALDAISAGMFLVEKSGRIVHANLAGHMLLNESQVLRAVGGRLVANDPATNQALLEIFVSAARGDMAMGVKGVAAPLVARNGERYIAHVLPLTSGARRETGMTHAAVAAVLVRKATLKTTYAAPEAIAKAYRLTASELRVLLAIVEIGGAIEVADALGVTEATVRTHLARLYAKTGTRRHADLVKLVAGFVNPLRE